MRRENFSSKGKGGRRFLTKARKHKGRGRGKTKEERAKKKEQRTNKEEERVGGIKISLSLCEIGVSFVRLF